MEQELIVNRARDAIRLCDNASFPKFFGFLRPEETALLADVMSKQGENCCFFGGYPSAERVFFGAFPDWCEDKEEYFPILPLTFSFRESDSLSHRQCLGTFMSCGITRESVGDILIEKGRAVAFFSKDIVVHVKENVDKIGGVGVTVTEGFSLPLPGMSGFETITDTVASPRLDCVISALAGCSRGQATALIEQKLITVNAVCTEKTVKTVNSGDTITIKGKGKFIIDSLEGRTKKNRIIMIAKKYI